MSAGKYLENTIAQNNKTNEKAKASWENIFDGKDVKDVKERNGDDVKRRSSGTPAL